MVISVFSTVPVLYGNDIQYGFDICFCKTKVSKEFSSTSCHSGNLRFYGKIFQIFNPNFLFFLFFCLVFGCFVFGYFVFGCLALLLFLQNKGFEGDTLKRAKRRQETPRELKQPQIKKNWPFFIVIFNFNATWQRPESFVQIRPKWNKME